MVSIATARPGAPEAGARRRLRAVVAGGGVAGSACAVALARTGADVTVYEAHADPAGPVGSFVSLAVNGLRALDALGVLAEVQAAGFEVDRQRMWSGRGRPLGDAARGRRSADPLRSVTLMRADLVGILRAAAERCGARIVTGERIEPGTGGDTGPLAGADLVVGADGMWSAVREALVPGGPQPAYAGLYSVSGVSGVSAAARLRTGPGPGPGLLPSGFNWIFARRGVFIYLPAPDGTVWWSAQVAAPRPPRPPGPPEDPAGPGLGELAGLFASEPAAADVLGAATQVWATTSMHVLPPVRRRQDGRMVLVGDAAHPVGAGQGAAIALEDAVVLARELAAADTVAAALASFDGLRHARAGKLARAAAANREAKTGGGTVTARIRELVMPVVFPRVYERATGWLYDFDPGWLPGSRR